jgi:hypothetical protein
MHGREVLHLQVNLVLDNSPSHLRALDIIDHSTMESLHCES